MKAAGGEEMGGGGECVGGDILTQQPYWRETTCQWTHTHTHNIRMHIRNACRYGDQARPSCTCSVLLQGRKRRKRFSPHCCHKGNHEVNRDASLSPTRTNKVKHPISLVPLSDLLPLPRRALSACLLLAVAVGYRHRRSRVCARPEQTTLRNVSQKPRV